MADKEDADFNQVIEVCKARGMYELMESRYDWNEEAICQFYATLYINTATNGHIHWMTQGLHYEVSMARFASYFHIGAADKKISSYVQ